MMSRQYEVLFFWFELILLSASECEISNQFFIELKNLKFFLNQDINII